MDMFLEALAQQWIRNMVSDMTRYAIFAIGFWLVLWVALKGLLHGRKIRTETPPVRQLILEFLVSLRTVAVFSSVGLIPFVLERVGWLHSHQAAMALGPVWFWACLALMIVAHDAYFYWAHRIIHDPRLFRRFHRRHHLSHNPSPFTAYSFDIGEAAVMAAFVPVWVILIPTPWPVVGLFVLHQIVRNTMGHSGYELFPAGRNGRPMFDWMTTVTHHDIHHAEARWNYGLYFTWWDRWMGTEHPQYHARFAQCAARAPLAAPPRRAA
jgi:sterol desaturase/sphingolipid hydroxylase (fatty acid hydroxylase superfamily)